MRPVFADAFYYLALMNEGDLAHESALALSESLTAPTITTPWVLTEVADAHAAPAMRRNFLRLLEWLRSDADCTILPATQELFDLGVSLYGQRLDKDWSLTDCISFAAMQQHAVTDALTGDHHFEQAGFAILLK